MAAPRLPILWRTGPRELLRHPWQAILALLGIALGVGVVVAVDVANDSAERAFALSVARISGPATHQIVAASGRLTDDEYVALAERLAGLPAAPVVEGRITIAGTPLTLLGSDPLALPRLDPSGAAGADLSPRALLTVPGAIVLSEADAERLGLSPGDDFEIEAGGANRPGHLAGTLSPSPRGERLSLDGLALADIATAQELTDQVGLIDRIDLAIDDATAQALSERLPPGLRIVPSETRGEAMREMTRAFRVNLTAMGLLALLVGAFIVYNTMTFAVLRRRAVLGTLRSLGVTRRELFALVLVEALMLALLGSALGLALGILTGSGLVHLVTRTISDLYFSVTVASLYLSPWTLAKGLVLGIGVTLLAALGPALEAASAPPRELLRAGSLERRGRGLALLLALGGVALMGLGWGLIQLPSRSLELGFVALFLVIAGFSLCVPAVLRAVAAAIAALARALRGPRAFPALLASRGVEGSITRTGLAAAALTVAVASSMGVAVMIESFRSSLVAWLDTTLQSDVYVSAPAGDADRPGGLLPAGIDERIARLPGVAEISRGRHLEVSSRAGPVGLLALDGSTRSTRGFHLVAGESEGLWAGMARGELVLVSEPLAFHQQLAPGGRVSLFTPEGWRDFTVGAIFRDYGSQRGMLVMDRGVYAALWADSGLTTLGVVTAPGAEPAAVAEGIRTMAREETASLLITVNRAIRDQSLTIFDRTFAVTHVLRTLAIGVAFVGVLAALLALQLEQGRDHAVLRATGMTRAEMAWLVLAQTSIIGLVAGLLAVPLGIVLGMLLIDVVNLRSFGWRMDLHLPWLSMTFGVMVAWLAALIAGVHPALAAARSHPARALRAE